MLPRKRSVISLSVFLVSLCQFLTLAASDDDARCPIGFNLSRRKSKENSVCYRLKEPEKFDDLLKDCEGNLYTWKLLQDLEKVSSIPADMLLWTEFKAPYDDAGIFVNLKASDKLLLSQISSEAASGFESKRCVTVDEHGSYHVKSCDQQAHRYCIVQPYDDDDDESDEGCPKDFYRFYSPLSTCLNKTSRERRKWESAKSRCEKKDASLISRGWLYAYAPVLNVLNKKGLPLGIKFMNNGDLQFQDTGNVIRMNTIMEENFQPIMSERERQSGLLALDNGKLRVHDKGFVFVQLVCEHEVAYQDLDLSIGQISEDQLILKVSTNINRVDKSDLVCFTDSEEYYPSEVNLSRLNNTNDFLIEPSDNGYYWCHHIHPRTFKITTSNKQKFVRVSQSESLLNTYAVKIRDIQNSEVTWENIDDLTKIWENKLRNMIYNKTGLGTELDDDLNLKVKKILENSVLLHVELSPNTSVLPQNFVEDNIKVYYMNPVYYCRHEDTGIITEGQFDTVNCKKYTCNGNFNDGLQLDVEEVEGCDDVPLMTEIIVRDATYRMPTLTPTTGITTVFRISNSSEDTYDDDEYGDTTTERWRPPPTTTTTEAPTDQPIVVDTLPPPPPDEQLQQVIADLEMLLNNDTGPLIDDITDTFDMVDVLLEEEALTIPGELLRLLDRLGERVNLNGSCQASTVRSNIALLMADAQPDNPILGLRINALDNDTFTENDFSILTADIDTADLSMDTNEAVVQLPSSVSATLHRISFVVFRNDNAFQSNLSLPRVSSRVVSVNVHNVIEFSEGEYIDIHMRSSNPDLDLSNMTQACAYWHFLDGNDGYWSQEGCTFIKAEQEGLLDTCRCDHLTHFAQILVPATEFSAQNENSLELISIIGCCLSILGITMVFLTAILFRTWRRDFTNKIWLQLCAAICMLAVAFLIVVFARFDAYNVTCMLTGMLLHYSVLVSFCWMLVAAVISYRRLVIVFSRDASHKLLKASVFAWGAPCGLIGILMAVSPRAYETDMELYNGSFCYPSGLALWLTIYTPIAIILLANWLLFVLIVRSVFASKTVQRHGDTNEALRCASVSCLLVFLFGLPWIFGLFAYNIVAAYLFMLTATFQGFVLFLFFVLGNKKTRDLWLNLLKIKQTRKVPVTSSTYTNRSAVGGPIGTSVEAPTAKPRSLAATDNSRFS